jgi:hypothetical protein
LPTHSFIGKTNETKSQFRVTIISFHQGNFPGMKNKTKRKQKTIRRRLALGGRNREKP